MMKKNSISINDWLLLSTSFCMILLACRVVATGYITYAFLAWNLFLAYIPYFISSWLSTRSDIVNNKWKLSLALFAWLMFMPNTFYILTDLFHLGDMKSWFQWFDLTLILAFAWNGVVLGILSIHRIESMLNKSKGKPFATVVICAVMWLIAFGVYIGRFLRFNSWDVLTNPFSLAREIGVMFIHPTDHTYTWAVTCCFSLLMIIVYYSVKRMGRELR